ncbi:MAG: hypothetical protein IJT45_07290 [Bacteroidales bacterium]|nr:hypothetical protein [Bacteroidales bacterium]
MTTKTIQYDGRSAALKQVLELFTTLGGRIIDKDESPYDQEFVKKIRMGEKSKKREVDVDKIWE